MTVRELIDMLKGMPQDSLVVIPGYEGGYDNPYVSSGSLIVDTNWDGQNKEHWYMGRHEKYYDYEDNGSVQPVNCVIVGRGK